MKLSFFILLSLTLNAFGYSDYNWSLKDIRNNIQLQERVLRPNDSNFFAIINGTRCIEGDLKTAYKELQVLSSPEIELKKINYTQESIELSATGPACSFPSPFPNESDVCYNPKVTTKTLTIFACDPNQKYFSKFKSPAVELHERVMVKGSKNNSSDIFYTQTLHVEQNPSEVQLSINFKSWAYGLSQNLISKNKVLQIRIPATTALNAQLDNTFSAETLSSDFGNNLVCKLTKKESFIDLNCKSSLHSITGLRLPHWTLNQMTSNTSFNKVANSLMGFEISKDGHTFVQGINFHSLSEMYEILYSKNQVQGCILDTISNLRFLKQEIQSCGVSCASASLNPAGYKVRSLSLNEEQGIVVHRLQYECVQESKYGYCEYNEVISEDQIVIPFCGI